MHIIQFSDLHYGSKDFRPSMLEKLIAYINEHAPDLCICTGDLTDEGKVHQYREIEELLRPIEVPLVCVPGNHDARNNGLMFFEQFFGKRYKERVFGDTLVLGLCSPMTDLRDGYLGNFQLRWIAKQLEKYPDHRKILAMHHHLIHVPDAGRNRDTIWDAGDCLELAQAFDVDLVLCGHRHVPHAYALWKTTLLYGCTSTTIKLRAIEMPCFNEILLTPALLEVHVVNTPNYEKTLLFRRENGTVKYIRRRNTRIEHLVDQELYKDFNGHAPPGAPT